MIEINSFLHDPFDEEFIFDFICENISDPPEICSEVVKQFEKNKSSSYLTLVLVIIIFIGIFYLIYQKCIKSEIKDYVKD